MNRKSIFNTLFVATFVGIILSFSMYFTLSATMRSEYQIEDDFFDGSKDSNRTLFSYYDDACIKNTNYYSYIREFEYKVFGNISSGNIMSGKNGFLFSSGKNHSGYNYISDYMGEIELSESELDIIYQYIEMRRKAYEDHGIDYILAVIPNTQTVYSEYMPDSYGEISENTVLSQITNYLANRKFDNFINLTDTMLEAKSEGILYNNTENSINALGAYYVYSGIVSNIKDQFGIENKIIPRNAFDLYTHHTEGKGYAVKAQLSSLIKNETVSMSNTNKYFYTTIELFRDLETTYVKAEFRDDINLKPSVLIEVTKDWDKIQLMPYFSNTFGMASYRPSHHYDKEALENSTPSIVVQTIHEDEIFSILKREISESYNEGLGFGDNPYTTIRPKNIGYVAKGENSVILTGFAEKGSEISIFGDGVETKKVHELDGKFVAVVNFENGISSKELFIVAKVEGKNVSEPFNIKIMPDFSVETDENKILVGSNSMIYKSNYGDPLIPNLSDIDEFVEMVGGKIRNQNILAEKDIKVIYGIIPQKISIYKDGAPIDLVDEISDYETLRSMSRLAMAKASVNAVDFTHLLQSNLESGKLFYQGSETPTNLAYYYMYTQLIEEITKDYPLLHPKSLGDFRKDTFKTIMGENFEELGFAGRYSSENVLRFYIEKEAQYIQKGSIDGKVNMSKEFESITKNKFMPKVIVVRDKAGTGMLNFMAPHFSSMYVLAEGETEINPSLIEDYKPDYIIYLCGEENITFGN